MGFRAERALISEGDPVRWVVISDDWQIHAEASTYLDSLRAADRSFNTERVYAGRVALFLSWCAESGVNWRKPTFLQLHEYLRWLAVTPFAIRKSTGAARVRSRSTANAAFTAASEFLRFGAVQGWVATEVPAMLTTREHLRFVPSDFPAGEEGQFRNVAVRSIKFRVSRATPEALTPQQVDQVMSAVAHARDRLLVLLMVTAGLRIGEALGLARQDMHLLGRSDMLGCPLPGPHLHVVRRVNENGALAKSRYPRTIPVTDPVIDAYADYQFERERLALEASSESVFVNLFRPPLGRAMRYSTVKDLFDRLAERCGFAVRPHMLRHTAATRWLEAGVAPDVVQALLGHVSFASTSVYLHASRERMREAVEMTAAHGRSNGAASRTIS